MIVIIGPFPPPVMGMAKVNKSISELLQKQVSNDIIIYDTSSKSIEKDLLYHLYKFISFIKISLNILFSHRIDSIYLSISGSAGQVYEIFFLLLIRIKKINSIICHHHSYNYINKKKWLSSILFWIGGRKATHIALSEGMATKLMQRYNIIKKTKVLSNILFVKDSNYEVPDKNAEDLITLGFLSNISKNKGIYEFLDLHFSLHDKHNNICSVIAGPFDDANIEAYVLNKINNDDSIKWIGPVYNEKKVEFFKSIDIFIFPTQYYNEAEPLVIYEAFSYNTPVIAYGRGCIPDMIETNESYGLVISTTKPFVKSAMPWLVKRINSPEVLLETKLAVKQNFISRYRLAQNGLNSFIQIFQNH